MGCQLKYSDGPAVPVATGLRGSPFGLLHALGCLRLVTDGVSEKDALHVALTCRVFRDLLWARFPIRPAGDPWEGKRIRTRVPADNGQLWARRLCYNPDTGGYHHAHYALGRTTGDGRWSHQVTRQPPARTKGLGARFPGRVWEPGPWTQGPVTAHHQLTGSQSTQVWLYQLSWCSSWYTPPLPEQGLQWVEWYPRANLLADNPALAPYLEAYDGAHGIDARDRTQPAQSLVRMPADEVARLDKQTRLERSRPVQLAARARRCQMTSARYQTISDAPAAGPLHRRAQHTSTAMYMAAKADEIGGWLEMHGLDHAEGLLEELMALVDDTSGIPAMRASVATLLTSVATTLDMLPAHQERLYTATASRDGNLLSAVAVADEAGPALYDPGPNESDEEYEDRQPTRHDARRYAGMLATPPNETAPGTRRRPNGSCDILLGRQLGMGCQLKYSDGPAVDAATLNVVGAEICICEATAHRQTESDALGNDGLGTMAQQWQRQRQGHADSTAATATGDDKDTNCAALNPADAGDHDGCARGAILEPNVYDRDTATTGADLGNLGGGLWHSKTHTTQELDACETAQATNHGRGVNKGNGAMYTLCLDCTATTPATAITGIGGNPHVGPRVDHAADPAPADRQICLLIHDVAAHLRAHRTPLRHTASSTAPGLLTVRESDTGAMLQDLVGHALSLGLHQSFWMTVGTRPIHMRRRLVSYQLRNYDTITVHYGVLGGGKARKTANTKRMDQVMDTIRADKRRHGVGALRGMSKTQRRRAHRERDRETAGGYEGGSVLIDGISRRVIRCLICEASMVVPKGRKWGPIAKRRNGQSAEKQEMHRHRNGARHQRAMAAQAAQAARALPETATAIYAGEGWSPTTEGIPEQWRQETLEVLEPHAWPLNSDERVDDRHAELKDTEVQCRSCHLILRRRDFSKSQLKHGLTGRCKYCVATGAGQRRHMHHSHAAKWHRALTHHFFERMATGIVTASAGYNAPREEMMQCWRLAEEELAEDQLAAEEEEIAEEEMLQCWRLAEEEFAAEMPAEEEEEPAEAEHGEGGDGYTDEKGDLHPGYVDEDGYFHAGYDDDETGDFLCGYYDGKDQAGERIWIEGMLTEDHWLFHVWKDHEGNWHEGHDDECAHVEGHGVTGLKTGHTYGSTCRGSDATVLAVPEAELQAVPAGLTLVAYLTPYAGCRCDGCGRIMAEGATMFGDEAADYDLCAPCHAECAGREPGAAEEKLADEELLRCWRLAEEELPRCWQLAEEELAEDELAVDELLQCWRLAEAESTEEELLRCWRLAEADLAEEEMLQCWQLAEEELAEEEPAEEEIEPAEEELPPSAAFRRLLEAVHQPPRDAMDAMDAGSRAEGFPPGEDYIAFPTKLADTARVYNNRPKLSARPCANMARYGHCSYGPRCHFLHPAPQRARACINFFSAEGCRFGARCHFLHGEQPDPGVRRGGDALEAQPDGSDDVLADEGPSLTIHWYGRHLPYTSGSHTVRVAPQSTGKVLYDLIRTAISLDECRSFWLELGTKPIREAQDLSDYQLRDHDIVQIHLGALPGGAGGRSPTSIAIMSDSNDDDDSDENGSDCDSEAAADAAGCGEASADANPDADHPTHTGETGAVETNASAAEYGRAYDDRVDTSEEEPGTSEEDEDTQHATGLISDEDDGLEGNADQTTAEDSDTDTTTEEARRPARNHYRLPAALKRWHKAGTVIAVWASATSPSSWWLARLTHDVDLEGGNAHMRLPLQWLTVSPPMPLPQGVAAQFQLESDDCDCTPARTVLLSLPPMASPEMTYDLTTADWDAVDRCVATSSTGSDDRRGGPQYSPSAEVSPGTEGNEELETGADGPPGRPGRPRAQAMEQNNTIHDFFHVRGPAPPLNSTTPAPPSAAPSPEEAPRHFWQTVCLHIPALANRTQTVHGRLVPKLSEQTVWTNGSAGLDMQHRLKHWLRVLDCPTSARALHMLRTSTMQDDRTWAYLPPLPPTVAARMDRQLLPLLRMLVHPQQAPTSLPFRNEYGVWMRHVPDGADNDLTDSRPTSPMLTTTLLLSDHGLPKLHALVRAKYEHKRAGNLELDSMQMTQMYEGWALQLLPTADMTEFVRQIEHQHSHMSISTELMAANASGTEPVDDSTVPAAAGLLHDGAELAMLTHGADITSDITGVPSPPHSTDLMQPEFQTWCDDEANATLEQLFATLRDRHADACGRLKLAAPCPHKLCSRCGLMLPRAAFGQAHLKSTKSNRTRTCRQCGAAAVLAKEAADATAKRRRHELDEAKRTATKAGKCIPEPALQDVTTHLPTAATANEVPAATGALVTAPAKRQEAPVPRILPKLPLHSPRLHIASRLPTTPCASCGVCKPRSQYSRPQLRSSNGDAEPAG